MKIVKFEDGTFGIRRGLFSWTYEFLDVSYNYNDQIYWWNYMISLKRDKKFFTRRCKMETLEKAQLELEAYKNVKFSRPDAGVPVK